MKNSGLIFKVLLSITTLLVAAVLVTNTIDAVRMKDPDYVRMLEDRRHYEEVISKKGLSLYPAAHWREIERPQENGPEAARPAR